MPRNKSEKAPRMLLAKHVQPASWPRLRPVELWELPDSVYKVRIKDSLGRWRQVITAHYDDALKVYDAMVDEFYFARITKLPWQRDGA